ncbi:hypothetical protein B0J15DRAFT_459163 [Fusarium solani]|uniref:Uncharacterized protein n=1 Tax=Fusarium solani TaxID=169388 RepID=A0A9P9RCM8_FUSSL|nr:uncharacterized protein B0J15DRAFT_459163 [Fusarium solani]KAH7274102.1 hypothetical protein B0J15DRAFT_459163 [Fusarium solani]
MGEDSLLATLGLGILLLLTRLVDGPGWSDPIDISFHMEAPSCRSDKTIPDRRHGCLGSMLPAPGQEPEAGCLFETDMTDHGKVLRRRRGGQRLRPRVRVIMAVSAMLANEWTNCGCWATTSGGALPRGLMGSRRPERKSTAHLMARNGQGEPRREQAWLPGCLDRQFWKHMGMSRTARTQPRSALWAARAAETARLTKVIGCDGSLGRFGRRRPLTQPDPAGT